MHRVENIGSGSRYGDGLVVFHMLNAELEFELKMYDWHGEMYLSATLAVVIPGNA